MIEKGENGKKKNLVVRFQVLAIYVKCEVKKKVKGKRERESQENPKPHLTRNAAKYTLY